MRHAPRQQVLVQTPTRGYTANDYECLLTDLGLGEAVPIYRQVFPQYLATLVPPGVGEWGREGGREGGHTHAKTHIYIHTHTVCVIDMTPRRVLRLTHKPTTKTTHT